MMRSTTARTGVRVAVIFQGLLIVVCSCLMSSMVAADGPSIKDADDLLNAMDKASENLHDFTANIRYSKEQGLLGDIQTRTGKLYYLNDQKTGIRKFFVTFSELRMGDTVEKQSSDFIFDGRWLVERINNEKQFIRREVVRAGDTFDPLAVDGPFPLPIGQSREAVLKRFNAQLLPAETEGRLKGFYKLQLKPKYQVRTGTQGDDDLINESIVDLTLWYDPKTLLPMQVVVDEDNGDIKTVKLAKVRVNKGIKKSLFDTTPPGPNDGWRVTVEPYRR